MCKPEGAKEMAESRTSRKCPWDEISCTCPLYVPTQRKNRDFSSLPAPPSTEEHEIAIQVAGHIGYVPEDVFNEPSKQVQSQGFQSYCKNEHHKLILNRFTWDRESSWKNPFKELMSMMFYRTFRLALVSTKYHHYCWNKDHSN
ncbi:hypothetical protein O181_058372 [Austropuccinia psidii MF-1]|uniref:Uncharacterized protein n=1 Tax=Austropuccinia psidii MF-1 TaxID=1389203 RepID=A0A9Q3EJL9_9BASI|nr:hypothetical protein [Austropuccinia psidii MF-1]